MCSILNTPEFYILLLVAAAAAIVAVTRPRHSGAVREEVLTGQIITGGADDFPRVEIDVTPGSEVVLRRSGWSGVSPGQVTALVEIKGFEITITEHFTPGGREQIDCVEFLLPTLAPAERYHVNYIADAIGRSVAFYFSVKPGMRVVRQLP